jgi:putative spermidine/putrescine transport system ATP-binding protein
MTRLAVQDVGKSFGPHQVLRDAAIDIAAGELVSLLGPSGCGKTTLLRIIAGFEHPDSGRLLLDGVDITRQPPAGRNMGMVFQAYSLFPNMTAAENVAFGLRVRGAAKRARLTRAGELLELVGLGVHRDKYPRQLSGGQQQRVALARALALEPAVLLLDEPLSALDAKVRVQLRAEIRQIQRRTGISTVFVTHDQEEALSISDRVAVMNAGRLVQVDRPAEIYREPRDGFVARFIGAAAVLPGLAEAGGVRLGGLLLPAAAAAQHAPGTALDLFLRPEDVRIEEAPGALAAEVQELTFLGATTRLRLRLRLSGSGGAAENAAEVWADLPSAIAERHAPGEQVHLIWPAEAPRALPRAP